ncbi:MAG TPA: hypothetical protein VFN13_10435 [Rudaea sp.]|nr:hypothetical protein [Rudaea sp.]
MRLQHVVMATIIALTFAVASHARAATSKTSAATPAPVKQAETAATHPSNTPPISKPLRTSGVTAFSLMTPEERKAYRAKMRSFKTPEERQAFRLENRKAMQKRADEKGEKLRPIRATEETRARSDGHKTQQQAADKHPKVAPTIPPAIKAGRH